MATTFSAKIDIIGVNPFVRPPDEILQAIFKAAGKDKGPIPVGGIINGAVFQQSLVRYQGDWRLYINTVMARAAGFKFSSIAKIVGEQVTMSVEYDPAPREYGAPPEFQAALDADPLAASVFAQLTPGRQKEILRYLGALKSHKSVTLNITRVVQHLRGDPTDALHALMHHPKR